MIRFISPILLVGALALLSLPSVASQSSKRCRRDTTSTCVLVPELTEGPYYWNTSLMRQNISEDRGGVPLRLQIIVNDVSTCSPIANAAVSLWHCDALGIYSHYIQASQNMEYTQNDNQTFLRGIQLTNASGVATFDTIYPGWYTGRTTHIHVKVHLGGTYINASSYYSGATYVHTGQLFFNDTLSNLVNQQSPYSGHSGSPTINSADFIYTIGGASTLMNVQYVNSSSAMSGGLITSIILAVTTTTTSSNVTSMTTASSNMTTITTSIATTVSTSMTSTSKAVTSSCGDRAGGSLFWLW